MLSARHEPLNRTMKFFLSIQRASNSTPPLSNVYRLGTLACVVKRKGNP